MTNLKLLLLFIFFSSAGRVLSQSKMDMNTIFVCIPATDYASLFSNQFVKDTLFFCKENTTRTDKDNYVGKYFMGEFATLEFLQPSGNMNFGDQLNDIGIEFKSRKIGLLDSLKNSNSKLEIEIEKVVYQESDNEKYAWYDALKLKENKTNLEFSILEYSAEYLKVLGFAEEDLKKSISPTDFNTVVYGNNKYPRKFKSIKSVELEVNTEGLKYLKQVSNKFHFKTNKNSIEYNGFKIQYSLHKKLQKIRIKNIEINLTESLPKRFMAVSPNIDLAISNNTAKLIFK